MVHSKRFANKIILVTGAARGIGAAAAELFAREGGTVYATDIDQTEAERSITDLVGQGLSLKADMMDVTRESEWDRVVGNIIDQHGQLDVLVNNAGIALTASTEDTSLDDWRRVMHVNVESVFLGTRKAISVMKEHGGAIVNLSSISGIVGDGMLAAYNSSKGSVRMFTKSAALHCADQGYNIRINSIHPGHTQTRLVENLLTDLPESERQTFIETMTSMIPMKRAADPMEIARPLVFLASEDASYMTGSELVVDGGFTAR